MNWKATYDTPLVNFSSDNLTICGKSIMEDPYSFYQPIIKKLTLIRCSYFTFEINLKSINAISKKQMYRILTIAKGNTHIKALKILWLNDPSDEEGYDLGKEFEDLTGIPFEYLDYA
jgi:hypothetical protein